MITEAHLIPVDDFVEHVAEDDCICGPDCEPVERSDGSFGYVYRHHSLDGRENREPPYLSLSRGRDFS